MAVHAADQIRGASTGTGTEQHKHIRFVIVVYRYEQVGAGYCCYCRCTYDFHRGTRNLVRYARRSPTPVQTSTVSHLAQADLI